MERRDCIRLGGKATTGSVDVLLCPRKMKWYLLVIATPDEDAAVQFDFCIGCAAHVRDELAGRLLGEFSEARPSPILVPKSQGADQMHGIRVHCHHRAYNARAVYGNGLVEPATSNDVVLTQVHLVRRQGSATALRSRTRVLARAHCHRNIHKGSEDERLVLLDHSVTSNVDHLGPKLASESEHPGQVGVRKGVAVPVQARVPNGIRADTDLGNEYPVQFHQRFRSGITPRMASSARP
eukprot:scaffold160126_cov31-Tisochrysis_lutea.AAC.2